MRGEGQAMVEGNKKQLNSETPRDLKTPQHTRTHTPSRVWEKRFPLLSFLSQRKTTIKTLSNTTSVASRDFEREKGSLPVGVRRSKTSLPITSSGATTGGSSIASRETWVWDFLLASPLISKSSGSLISGLGVVPFRRLPRMPGNSGN